MKAKRAATKKIDDDYMDWDTASSSDMPAIHSIDSDSYEASESVDSDYWFEDYECEEVSDEQPKVNKFADGK